MFQASGATAGLKLGIDHGVRGTLSPEVSPSLDTCFSSSFDHACLIFTPSGRPNPMQEISRTGACFLFWSFHMAGISGGGPLSTWLSQRFHAS